MNRYKICLIGATATGKTSFLSYHANLPFRQAYISTIACNMHTIIINTNYGEYILDLCDVGGGEPFYEIHDVYYNDSNAAIAFYTNESKSIRKLTDFFISDYKRTHSNALIVNVMNKMDKTHQENNDQVYEYEGRPTYAISIKEAFNCDNPLLHILRVLTQKQDLIII